MSNIEWTDTTWNPLAGCSKVSAGCRNCYAEVMGKRLRAMALADGAAGRDPGRKRAYLDAVDERGRWTGKVAMMPEALCEPLGWRKPRRVFVNSMSDLFHPTVPFEFIAAALDPRDSLANVSGHLEATVQIATPNRWSRTVELAPRTEFVEIGRAHV